jgi:thioredoxin-related protein
MKNFLLTAVFICSVQSFSQVKFTTGTLGEVMKSAKEQNKILMVDVLTEWCKWCIELDNKVYSREDIGSFANANQINYKIDAEKDEGIEFAKKYKVKGYPTILFLDADGNEIDRIYGYVPAKDFLEMMTDYNKGINTMPYLLALLEKEPDNLEANLKIADKYLTNDEKDKAKIHLNKIIEADPQNSKGKTDDAKFRLASLSGNDSVIFELEFFIKNNPESDQLKDAYISLSESYYYGKSDLEKSEKFFNETLILFPGDEQVKSSYGQFLNARASGLAEKGTSEEDYRKGLKIVNDALLYVAGSVNEASSYFIMSKLYYNLKDFDKALESVDKALKIFNRKLYRDHKEKVVKQLSTKQ